MLETKGDQYQLDCPVCGEPGLNDLWDGGLEGIGLEGDTVCWCGYCNAKCDVSVRTEVTCTATPATREEGR